MDAAISTHGLVKCYGAVRAVDGVELTVRRGEIYGFLGRNGAGKTTTIRMLLGLIRPTSGEVRLLGQSIRPGQQRALAKVGCLVETAAAYPNLTVRENLDICRRLSGSAGAAVDAAIGLLRLDAYADRRAGQLSLGNKQRLALARALLHVPDLLVLDEPTNGLDPAGIVEIRELLRSLARQQGTTIFMSSHILPEVTQLADRIAIIHAGKLVEELDIAMLHARALRHLDLASSDPARAAVLLEQHLGITHVTRTGADGLRVFEGLDRVAEIARVLVSAGLALTHLAIVEEDLEARFLRLTAGAP